MTRHALDRKGLQGRLVEWTDMVQIVNTDIDGLLSAAILWHYKRWPIVGFYDTEHLWVSEAVLDGAGRLRLDRTVFVDIDMCWPGSTSISQHVICRTPGDATAVSAFSSTLNPNLAAGITWENYTPKYPFGTFQWLCWLLEEPVPPLHDQTRTGLMWMPDGGFTSAQGAWATNCRQWATELMPGSGLAPLFEVGRVAEAGAFVEAAMEDVISASMARRKLWRHCQYVTSVRQGTSYSVMADPMVDAERAEIERVLHAVAGVFGWNRVTLPTDWKLFVGQWDSKNAKDTKMDLWADHANRRQLVSCAFIDRRTFAFTRPRRSGSPSAGVALDGQLEDVLP